MQEQDLTKTGNPNAAAQPLPDMVETLGAAKEIEQRGIELALVECTIPAEDVPEGRLADLRARKDRLMGRGRDADESVVAGLEFAQQLKQRAAVVHQNSRR